MNIYLITDKARAHDAYDTFDSAIVSAPDAETARNMNPMTGEPVDWNKPGSEWASSKNDVKVVLLGRAEEGEIQRVILASFNAG